VELADLVDSY